MIRMEVTIVNRFHNARKLPLMIAVTCSIWIFGLLPLVVLGGSRDKSTMINSSGKHLISVFAGLQPARPRAYAPQQVQYQSSCQGSARDFLPVSFVGTQGQPNAQTPNWIGLGCPDNYMVLVQSQCCWNPDIYYNSAYAGGFNYCDGWNVGNIILCPDHTNKCENDGICVSDSCQ